jgi:hypothetical protein
MYERGGACVPNRPDRVALAQAHPGVEARRGGFEVTVEKEVVAQLPALTQRMAGDDRRPEKRPDVDDVRVFDLVFESHERHGGPPLLEEVDGAVSHVAKAPAAALRVVGAIQVVAAGDAPVFARNGIAIRIVVGGPLGAPRDLVVSHPSAVAIVMRVEVGFGFGRVIDVHDANACVAIRQRGRRTCGHERSFARGALVRILHLKVERRAASRPRPEREPCKGERSA